MPGLEEIGTGTYKITICHLQLPDGAQVAYAAKDSSLVTALYDGLKE